MHLTTIRFMLVGFIGDLMFVLFGCLNWLLACYVVWLLIASLLFLIDLFLIVD